MVMEEEDNTTPTTTPNNTNTNTNSDASEMIDAELRDIEQSLEGRHNMQRRSSVANVASSPSTTTSSTSNPGHQGGLAWRGRAAFQSVASSLRNLRDRLEEASSNLTGSVTERLSQRLETAQLAHSSRRPLELVRQEHEEHEEQQQQEQSSDSAPPRPAPMPFNRRVASDGAPSGQRRHSELMASRSQDFGHGQGNNHDDGDDDDDDDNLFSQEMHQRTKLNALQEAARESMSTTTSASDDDLTMDDNDNENSNSSESPILLTQSQSQALSGSLLVPTDACTTTSNNNNLESQASPIKMEVDDELLSDDPEEPSQPPPQPQQSIYSWGDTGLLSLHDDDAPRDIRTCSASSSTSQIQIAPNNRLAQKTITCVATSTTHTACVTTTGSVLTSGWNQKGCVDPTLLLDNANNDDSNDKKNDKNHAKVVRPTLLECLSILNQRIRQVSCGYDHTAALSEHGTVLTWGSNEYGQLGHRQMTANTSSTATANNTHCRPQGLLLTGGRRAASVACGHYFTLVLTTRMCVLACGVDTIAASSSASSCANTVNDVSSSTTSTTAERKANHVPSSLPALLGLPLVAIAAGHHHAVVLTSSGTALAWGENDAGCCGREFPHQLSTPVEMHVPPTRQMKRQRLLASSSNVSTSSASSSTSSALVVSSPQRRRLLGNPFPNWATWEETSIVPVASPQQQQLQQQHHHPESVVSLAEDVAIVHATCGEHHTVLVTRSGGLLVCGSNYQGQLGFPVVHDNDDDHQTITELEPLLHPEQESRGVSFVTAEAGASHTLLLDSEGSVWQMGGGKFTKGPECVLKQKGIAGIAAGGDQSIAMTACPGGGAQARRHFAITSPNRNNMITDAASSSAVVDTRAMANNLEELLNAVAHDNESDRGELAAHEIAKRTEELLQNPAVMNSLYFGPNELDQMYTKLISAGNTKVKQIIASAIERGIGKGLEAISPETARMMYPEAVRCLLIYIRFLDRTADEYGGSNDITFDSRGKLASRLMEAILGLPFEGYKNFLKWATSMYPADLYVKMLVKPLLYQLEKGCKVVIDTNQVVHASLSVGSVPLIVAVLQWLYTASERLGIANSEEFISKAFDQLPVEVLYNDLHKLKTTTQDKQKKTPSFNICESPFLFSPTVKRNLLKLENQIEMYKAATAEGVTLDLSTGQIVIDPFFKLEVERDKMLEQTLDIIRKTKPMDLRKLLRVKFKGEEGVDAGGVTKEFFNLVSEELFDISSGMWTDRYSDGGMTVTWFNSNCVWDDQGYELAGVLVGLALYNSVLVDVNFPMAVYRKLLGYPLGLEDMVDQELKRGFQQLLDYDSDDVEDVFCLNFEVSWVDDLGEEKRRELKPGGANIPVTHENKEEYVRLYVSWLLVDSIYAQWESFENGVMRVMEGSSITICRPEELEMLVVGTPELDFDALESNTEYEGGYDANSETVKHFWKYVKSLEKDGQLNFLKFATGSSKAPIGGLGALPFKVQRAGPDSLQLPTTHTCFNTLILPDYGDYDKIAERLGRAIVECEGFGLE